MGTFKKKIFAGKDKAAEWMDKGNRTTYLFLLPYFTMFLVFIVLPIIIAIFLSFTYFNGVEPPTFVGFKNYIYLITEDPIFIKTVLPNTILFALIVGPGGYLLSFVLAWMLAQVSKFPRTILALIIYAPSMTAGVAMTVIWQVVFSGSDQGIINGYLLSWGFIDDPIQFLQSPEYLMSIMIIVSLWGAMGVGFLAMLAGILSVDKELYEAAYMDGLESKTQEMFYITIPSIKSQMLFGAVMSIVGTFSAGAIGVQLSGSNPTPQNSGQLILNHIEDYGVLRAEIGTSAALSVILLLIIYAFTKVFSKLFTEVD